jgi:actin-related protein
MEVSGVAEQVFKVINSAPMVFLGGAVYANLVKDTPAQWISRRDYQEQGSDRCVQRLNQICPR